MFKDFHDRLFRRDHALRAQQARSNPVFHGRAGLRFIDVIGRRVWPINMILSAIWWTVFAALGLFMWAPETYANWLEVAEKAVRRDLPVDDPWDYFFAWWLLTVALVSKGFAEQERDKLLAEERLPLRD